MIKDLKTVILAAGKGTRMKSDTPKVLHEIFSKPILGRVLDSAILSGSKENIVVTGHGADKVEKYISAAYGDYAVCALQEKQLGTAHALMSAADKLKGYEGTLLVLCGDTPLITGNTLFDFVKFHNENNADITVMSALFDNPFGYGRIVRDGNNNIKAIIEEKDADIETKKNKRN